MSPGIDRFTDLGGARHQFPDTSWSRLRASGRPGSAEARAALQALFQSYWKPVYAYVRFRWSKSNEDAKDLTQSFFAWILESGFLDRADAARGRFRSFITSALENFLVDRDRWERRDKRGGGARALELDDAPESLVPASAATPEEALIEAWRRDLFLRAEARLEEKLAAEGKRLYYDIFRDYYLAPGGELDYAGVAARHGITTVDVSNHLMHAKRRFQAILTDLVSETVGSEAELQEELKALFGR